MEDTGIEMKQLTNWFVNNRKRYWKPRIEARLQNQAQAAAAAVQAHAVVVAAVNAAKAAQPAAPAVPLPSSPAGFDMSSLLVSPDTRYKPSILVPSPTSLVKGIDGHTASTVSLSSSMPPSPATAEQNHHNQHQVIRTTLPAMLTTSSSAVSTITASLTAQLLAAHQQQHYPMTVMATDMNNAGPATATTVSAGTLPTTISTNSLSGDEGEQQHKMQHHQQDVTSSADDFEGGGDPFTATARNVSFSSLEQVSGQVTSKHVRKSSSSSTTSSVDGAAAAEMLPPRTLVHPSSRSSKPHKKRSHIVVEEQDSMHDAPRKRFRRVSLDLWIESCQKAAHVNDEALPSLEEASRLFGYSNDAVC